MLQNDKGVLLFGASQRTGLEVARILAARGERVTAFVRPTSDRTELDRLAVNYVVGDVTVADDVGKALAGGDYRAVICTVGGARGDDPRPDFIGVRNIVDAVVRSGVRRMLLVTVIGAGDSRAAISDNAWKFLGPIIELKTRAEDYLTGSGLDATILRPGGMASEAATGTAIKTEDHTAMGIIQRADLAALVVECLDDPATVGKIYHAVDPGNKERPPLERGESVRPGATKP
jgi:uncharacterized protein YbjT (DUF2867 family)